MSGVSKRSHSFMRFNINFSWASARRTDEPGSFRARVICKPRWCPLCNGKFCWERFSSTADSGVSLSYEWRTILYVLPDSTCKCHGSLIKTRTEGCWVVPYRLWGLREGKQSWLLCYNVIILAGHVHSIPSMYELSHTLGPHLWASGSRWDVGRGGLG